MARVNDPRLLSAQLPDGEALDRNLARRNLRGGIWQRVFAISLSVGILALIALFFNIVNQAFGYVAATYQVQPTELVEGGDLSALNASQLAEIIRDNESENRLKVYIRDYLSQVSNERFTTAPLREVLAGYSYPGNLGDVTINDLSAAELTALLGNNFSRDQLQQFIEANIVGETVVHEWTLFDSLFNEAGVREELETDYPEHDLFYFRTWLNLDFLTTPMSSNPVEAGIRTALFGTLLVLLITVVIAFPIGVGAAIYLVEYATNTPFNRLIETNIRNLAGVPSIIYGLLGLAVFVRLLSAITQGRTVVSAALTMALLILPVIIINAQEALRAVPPSIREGSYGMGATKWQTIWRQVLPAAMPGILTGTILAMSRAIGETAPLIVVGASTFIIFDPQPFSRFTALPIQIFNWTARPQDEWRSLAAAAIVTLLVMLLSFNATAIILRQRFRRKLQG